MSHTPVITNFMPNTTKINYPDQFLHTSFGKALVFKLKNR